MTGQAVVQEGLPVPAPDRDTTPFWDGTARKQLMVQHCQGCDRWIWKPRPLCPGCHSCTLAWEEISGQGEVASWIVVHPPVLPALASLTPYVTLLVELDVGVRMTGNLVDDHGRLVRAEGAALDGLTIGAGVSLRWREQAGWTLPCWTLSS
jgi:uncharacterized protein